MKKQLSIIIIMIALTALFVLGCQTARTGHRPKIVIYTSMYADVVDAVSEKLTHRFPNYRIEFVQGGTGILQARIAQEMPKGRLSADILMIAEPAYSLELQEKGILHPFMFTDAHQLVFDYDPDGYWYPVRVSNMVLAYNPARHMRVTVPNSFFDFAYDTRVGGAVSMRNPLVSGTTMAALTAFRDKYGFAYFEALGRQRVIIDYGVDESLLRLETGESKTVMILEESILNARQKRNLAFEIIYPTDGTVVIPSNIMIINNQWSANRNTQAAEEIAEWFLSMEGQAAIVAGWMHSVRSDFPYPPNGSIPIREIQANSIPVIWENVFRQHQEIRQRFEEYIASGRY
ncbi:MAG: extracellular solute-binding protein [Treponema sp.]|nr:extracellular solute-binding protein [Treponema sp.]